MSQYNILSVFWCLLTLEICSTVATSKLIANPEEFNEVVGPALTVTCTFDNDSTSNFVSLVSIILYKGDELSQANTRFTELAWVTYFNPKVVNVLPPVNASTKGLISNSGQSFLSLYWEHPSLTEEGLYQCNITGLDRTGDSVEISHTLKVTADRSDVKHLIETVRQQNKTITELKSSLETYIARQSSVESALKYTENHMNYSFSNQEISGNSITNLTLALTGIQTKLRLLQTASAHLFFIAESSKYNEAYYLVSKEESNDSDDSQITCVLAGGYLAEIDDLQEHLFIADFLKSQNVLGVLTGGTDEGHEGQWIWRSSQKAMSYTNWELSNTSFTADHHCLGLYSHSNYQWVDVDCKLSENYLCEIPAF